MRRVWPRRNRPIAWPTVSHRSSASRRPTMLAGRRWGLVQVAANCLLRLPLPLVDNPTQLLQQHRLVHHDLLKVLPADLQRGHLFQRYRTGGPGCRVSAVKPRNVPFLRVAIATTDPSSVVTVSRTLPAITKVIPMGTTPACCTISSVP